MAFGLPYKGSKNTICSKIINLIPTANRFVDLFGGGGAVSHCAFLSKKYNEIIYNEVDELVFSFFNNAITSVYENFTPSFIEKEIFNLNKLTDPFTAFCWSFGNNGKDYIWGKNKVDFKRKLFNYVVNGVEFDNFKCDETCSTIKSRILYTKKILIDNRLEPIERLNRVKKLSNLKIKTNLGDYREFIFNSNDVVYCDPPYENTSGYNRTNFNSKEFYDWVYSRDFPIYFSSYEISDKRFRLLETFDKNQLFDKITNSKKVKENLFCNF